jgi:glycosyltransferase involved in cell wall biosynthesis
VIVSYNEYDLAKATCRELEKQNCEVILLKVDKQQPDIGLSALRNLGIQRAKGDYVAFIDDDAYPGKEWASEILKAIDSGGEIIGGPTMPLFTSTTPKWLTPRFNAVLGVNEKDISGCNMTIHKSVFSDVGYFNPRLGRQKGMLMSHEETQLLHVAKQNHKYVFASKAIVYHKIRPNKLRVVYALKWFFYSGKSLAVFRGRSVKTCLVDGAKLMVKCCLPQVNESDRLLYVCFLLSEIGRIIGYG